MTSSSTQRTLQGLLAEAGEDKNLEKLFEAVEDALKTVFQRNAGWNITRSHLRPGEKAAWALKNISCCKLRVALRVSAGNPVLVVEDESGKSLDIDLPSTPAAAYFSTVHAVTPYAFSQRALTAESEAARAVRSSSLDPIVEKLLSLYTPVVRNWYMKAAETIKVAVLAKALSGCIECDHELWNVYCETLDPLTQAITSVKEGTAATIAYKNASKPLYLVVYRPREDVADVMTASYKKLAEINNVSERVAALLLRNLYLTISLLERRKPRHIFTADANKVVKKKGLACSPLVIDIGAVEILDRLRKLFNGYDALVDEFPDLFPALLAVLPKTVDKLRELGVNLVCGDCKGREVLQEAWETVRNRLKEALATILPLGVVLFGGRETATRVVDTASEILRGSEPPSMDEVFDGDDESDRTIREKLRPLYEEALKVAQRARKGWLIGLEDIVAALSYSLATEYLAKIHRREKRSRKKTLMVKILDDAPEKWPGVAARVLLASSLHPVTAHWLASPVRGAEEKGEKRETYHDIIHFLEKTLESHLETGTISSASILLSKILSLDVIWALLTESALTSILKSYGSVDNATVVRLIWTEKGVMVEDKGGNRGNRAGRRIIRKVTEAALDSFARLAALMETGEPVYRRAEVRVEPHPSSHLRKFGEKILVIKVEGDGWSRVYKYERDYIDPPSFFNKTKSSILMPSGKDAKYYVLMTHTVATRMSVAILPVLTPSITIERKIAFKSIMPSMFYYLGFDLDSFFSGLIDPERSEYTPVLVIYMRDDDVEHVFSEWKNLVMPVYGERGVEVKALRREPGVSVLVRKIAEYAEDNEAGDSFQLGGEDAPFYENINNTLDMIYDIATATEESKLWRIPTAIAMLARPHILGAVESAVFEILVTLLPKSNKSKSRKIFTRLLRLGADTSYSAGPLAESLRRLRDLAGEVYAIKKEQRGFMAQMYLGSLVNLKGEITPAYLSGVRSLAGGFLGENVNAVSEVIFGAIDEAVAGLAAAGGVVEGKDVIRYLLQGMVPVINNMPALPSTPDIAQIYRRHMVPGRQPLVLAVYKEVLDIIIPSIPSLWGRPLSLTNYESKNMPLLPLSLHPATIYLLEEFAADYVKFDKLVAKISSTLASLFSNAKGRASSKVVIFAI